MSAGQDDRESSSGRSTQTDEQMAIAAIAREFPVFEEKFKRLMQARANFRLRLELVVDRGRLTDIDINEFTKIRPLDRELRKPLDKK